MRESDVIGEKTPQGWRPSFALMREWKRLGGDLLPPGAEFADQDGKPTRSFLGAWRAAFWTTTVMNKFLPANVVIVRNGKPTREFIHLLETVA